MSRALNSRRVGASCFWPVEGAGQRTATEDLQRRAIGIDDGLGDRIYARWQSLKLQLRAGEPGNRDIAEVNGLRRGGLRDCAWRDRTLRPRVRWIGDEHRKCRDRRKGPDARAFKPTL